MGGWTAPAAAHCGWETEDLLALTEDGLARFRREYVGIIFQQHHLVPYLSAVENVMLAQYFHSVPDEEEAISALERVGLGHRLKNRPGELSGGEQQRVCIARAIINSPKLLLGDEPTGNLDHKSTLMVMELLKELRAEERFTVVMVTHNQEVATWGDRTIYLDDGILVREERINCERDCSVKLHTAALFNLGRLVILVLGRGFAAHRILVLMAGISGGFIGVAGGCFSFEFLCLASVLRDSKRRGRGELFPDMGDCCCRPLPQYRPENNPFLGRTFGCFAIVCRRQHVCVIRGDWHALRVRPHRGGGFFLGLHVSCPGERHSGLRNHGA